MLTLATASLMIYYVYPLLCGEVWQHSSDVKVGLMLANSNIGQNDVGFKEH